MHFFKSFKTPITLLSCGLVMWSCSSSEEPDNNPPSLDQNAKNDVRKVLEYSPAVGQFVNIHPKYEKGDTAEIMLKKADIALSSTKADGLVSLGGYGGYVVLEMHETIENRKGFRDFKVLGNTFTTNNTNELQNHSEGSSEPGIILVAYDFNKNGRPDSEEWYEIAGSEHVKGSVVSNYEISYHLPTTNPETGLENPIYWEDNQGNSGYKSKTNAHLQSYYPMWLTDTKLTFKGTLLPSNARDVNGDGSLWLMQQFEYGYADNASNNSEQAAIDIDWAIDKQGNKVNLPGVNFIKIHTGIHQEVGTLGELSTEVMGVQNLHRMKIEITSF